MEARSHFIADILPLPVKGRILGSLNGLVAGKQADRNNHGAEAKQSVHKSSLHHDERFQEIVAYAVHQLIQLQ
jgi:hypothetical protein